MAPPVLRDVLRTRLSPYVTLVERRIEIDGRIEAYHSLAQDDYVTVLAITRDGRIPLVRQYRPAMDREVLELPGGLVDEGEAPEVSGARELEEEAGFRPTAPLRLLGTLDPDSGRLENRLWAYLATGVEPVADWKPEPGIDCLLVDSAELLSAITNGRFTHALHIGIVGLALAAGAL